MSHFIKNGRKNFYDDLGFYLPNGDYTVEKGEIEVYIGADCLTENKIILTII